MTLIHYSVSVCQQLWVHRAWGQQTAKQPLEEMPLFRPSFLGSLQWQIPYVSLQAKWESNKRVALMLTSHFCFSCHCILSALLKIFFLSFIRKTQAHAVMHYWKDFSLALPICQSFCLSGTDQFTDYLYDSPWLGQLIVVELWKAPKTMLNWKKTVGELFPCTEVPFSQSESENLFVPSTFALYREKNMRVTPSVFETTERLPSMAFQNIPNNVGHRLAQETNGLK